MHGSLVTYTSTLSVTLPAVCLPGRSQRAHAHNHLHTTLQASIPCILYVYMMASNGPYLKGGDDYTSEATSLYMYLASRAHCR